ncbi:MAG: GNAT family N-acetyltransferase [Ruminococcus sp.]|nr:GNAT family N-acetyltransferase [Ruminococcus sp.]
MRIRPYIESKDYEYIAKWIDNEKVHAMWCAGRIPYPVTKENFQRFLEKNALDWVDSAYVATEDDGETVGFFCYCVNTDDNTGFLKFVIVDREKRGTGYGEKMLRLALQYAFTITGVDLVQLNVFDENTAAKRCYEKVGFVADSVVEEAFSYQGEVWRRCHMVVGRSAQSGNV